MKLCHVYWDVSPTIFSWTPLFRWYGLCWAVGLLLAYWVVSYIFKKENNSKETLDLLVVYLVLGAILGARLGHVLFYDPIYYFNHPVEILPFKLNPEFEFTGLAGLASHGGVIGGIIALIIFNRKFKLPIGWLLDRLAIGGSLLGCFIRIGNLMNSEIVGKVSNMPWAFVFIKVDSQPRHPSQLYEAISYFLIFGLLFLLWYRYGANITNGRIFGLGLSIIFILRFLIEFIKENQVAFEEEMVLNMGQFLSLPFILIGLTWLFFSKRLEQVLQFKA